MPTTNLQRGVITRGSREPAPEQVKVILKHAMDQNNLERVLEVACALISGIDSVPTRSARANGKEPIGNEEFLRLRDVIRRIGLSRTTIYRLIGDGRFPAPVKLSERASAWRLGEVQAWAAQRIASRQPRVHRPDCDSRQVFTTRHSGESAKEPSHETER